MTTRGFFCFINLSWLKTNKQKLNILKNSILFKMSLCLVWLMVQSVKTEEQMSSHNRAVSMILFMVCYKASHMQSPRQTSKKHHGHSSTPREQTACVRGKENLNYSG